MSECEAVSMANDAPQLHWSSADRPSCSKSSDIDKLTEFLPGRSGFLEYFRSRIMNEFLLYFTFSAVI